VAPERTGVVLLRVWIENGSPDGLRVRIVAETVPRSSEPSFERVVASVDEAVEIVRRWLDDFVAAVA
jgi:hypothetical protein